MGHGGRFEKESSTYTYLVANAITRKAALIDPVDLMVARDVLAADNRRGPCSEA